MKTFNSFIAEKTLESRLIEVATLMVEKDVDANEFIKTYFENNNPELAALLLEAGAWDGIKSAAGHVWNGIQSGAQAFARNAWGPQAKYDAALKSLIALQQVFNTDPQLKNWAGSQGALVNQIRGIIKQLGQLRSTLPHNQTQASSNQWAGNNPGNPTPPPVVIPHPASGAAPPMTGTP